LPTGQVLASDAQGDGGDARLWNPSTNTFIAVPNTHTNIFCAGHCALSDGRVLVVGGHAGAHIGLTDANIFNPQTNAWTLVRPMNYPRWYPTATALPDGRVLVTSGEVNCDGCYVEIPEVYTPSNNTWTRLSGAPLVLPYYPHMFVLPDGRVLAASTSEDSIVTQILDLATQTWSVVDPTPVDGGSAVMFLPGRVMKSGTSADPDMPTRPSAANTYVLDATGPSPSWEETAPMAFPRAYHNLTLLPDGTVLATGGGVTTDAVDLSGGVEPVELWSPVTQTWTMLAELSVPRLYHSIALLLPDGRVLVGGGGRFFGVSDPTDLFSAQIFSPPYLFKGPRPVITSAPAAASYGTTMTVQTPDAARIATVSLIKLGSVTHNFNEDQRFVPLAFTAGAGDLSVLAPGSPNLAPPGYYMLFIVDTNGVPSAATFVKVQ
jgi:WD40 repeat protein